MSGAFAGINGARLWYRDEGSGTPLVLVHGFANDHACWDEVSATWTRSFRVIRHDLRGYGKSTLPDGPYSHEDDLAALLGHLGIERAHVLGLSMGGGIATHFALTRPQLTRRLVLVSPALQGWQWSSDWRRQWTEVVELARTAGAAAARRKWATHPLFAPARRDAARAARSDAMIDAYSGWHWLNKDPVRFEPPGDVERLAQLAAPTLVILGEQDLPDFQGVGEVLRSNAPDVRLEVVPDAGHLLNLEAPAELARRVSTFLAAAT